MKRQLIATLLSISLAAGSVGAPITAHAQSDASALSAVSTLPVASIVVGGSAVASAALALPIALSATGAVLIVKTVESTARGTLCVLERASDGARVSLEIAGASVATASLAVGATVTVSVVGTGAILSVAGEVIAFVANKLGEALLYNEQLT